MQQKLTRAVTLRYSGLADCRSDNNSSQNGESRNAKHATFCLAGNPCYGGAGSGDFLSSQRLWVCDCATCDPSMSAGYRLPLDPSILLGSTPPPPTVAPHNGVESADATWGPERGRYPSLSCPVMMTRPFPTLLDSTMYSNDEFADWSSSQPLLPQEVSSSVSQPLLEDDSYHQSIYHAPDVYDHQSGNWRSIMPSTAIPATSHPGLVPDGGSHPPPLVLSPPTSSLAQYPCCWSDDPRCSGWVQGSNREMSEHLRSCHDFVGHEKDVVPCNWDGCGARMQRMNLARHIVSTHLRVRVRCRWCGRSFTRSDVTSRHEKECDENLKRFLIV